MYNDEDVLIHYGVPGMKWGKRVAKAVGTSVNNRNMRRQKVKAANAKFQKGVKELHKSGKGKDVAAITELAKKLDAEVKTAKQFGKKAKPTKADKAAMRDKLKNIKSDSKAQRKKAFDDFIGEMQKLDKAGRSNDIDAIKKADDAYTKRLADIKAATKKYKAAVKKQRKG